MIEDRWYKNAVIYSLDVETFVRQGAYAYAVDMGGGVMAMLLRGAPSAVGLSVGAVFLVGLLIWSLLAITACRNLLRVRYMTRLRPRFVT